MSIISLKAHGISWHEDGEPFGGTSTPGDPWRSLGSGGIGESKCNAQKPGVTNSSRGHGIMSLVLLLVYCWEWEDAARIKH